MKVNYNLAQINAAAKFIWDNNPSVFMWPDRPQSPQDIADGIIELAIAQAKQNMEDPDSWISWTGTGGYVMVITSDGEEYGVDIDVYVDPAVGKKSRLITEHTDDEDDV